MMTEAKRLPNARRALLLLLPFLLLWETVSAGAATNV